MQGPPSTWLVFEILTFVPSYVPLKTDRGAARKATSTIVHYSETDCKPVSGVQGAEATSASQRTCHLVCSAMHLFRR